MQKIQFTRFRSRKNRIFNQIENRNFLSVDGSYCLTCGSDRKIKLWNPYKKILLKTYGGHGNEVLTVTSSCDSSHILSGSSDKTVILWDVSTGQTKRRFRGHASTVTCVKFNEEANVCLSGSQDNTVMLWDIRCRNPEPIQVLKDAKDSITSIHVTDSEIYTASADCFLRRYDLRSASLVSDFLGSPISFISLSHDEKCIVASLTNNTVLLMEKSSGKMLAEYSGHKCNDYHMENAINPSDNIVMSGSISGTIWCWDLLTSQVVLKIEHESYRPIQSLSMHPKNDVFLSASTQSVSLWEIE